MAGAGFKDFAVGEILTASDVDTYLMQQSVMRFADAAARGSALGTATGTAVPLAEGMVSYLDDVNYMQVFDGTRWRDGGVGIGSNVVQAVKTDVFTTTSTSLVDVTGLSVTITPSSDTSKVLVLAEYTISNENISAATVAQLVRGSTSIYEATSAGSRPSGSGAHAGANIADSERFYNTFTNVYLDSPATNTATVYKLQLRATSGVATLGRGGQDTDDNRSVRVPSSITVIEVAA